MAGPALQGKLERAMQHHRAGDRARAEELYRQVLAKDRTHVVATNLLGALLLEIGNNEEAVDLLSRAIAREPGQAVFFANLGEAQRRLERYADAISSLRRAVALRPNLAEAHYTLAVTLRAEGLVDEAIASFERALALKPGLMAALIALSGLFFDLGQLDDARDACERALQIDRRAADAHQQLGFVLTELGRVGDGVASYRQALDLKPDHRVAHSNLVYALAFHPGESSASILKEAAAWGRRHAGGEAGTRFPHPNDRDPGRRLRVGYVSPDFRTHCQALFMVPLLEHRDRSAAEVIAYSMVKRPDEVTERIRGLCDGFRPIAALGDADIAEAIRSDRIDILVDLTMHMADNRLHLFAARPAPVQVAWLAYPGTTGLPAMDYRITDAVLDPPDEDVTDRYSERSVRLPDSFWCYDPLTRVPEVNPLPAASEAGEGRVTFGCLNSFKKTNGDVFALWAQVLRAVDGSRLLLSTPAGDPRTRACESFERAGVDPGRLDFVDQRPRAEYLALYHRIDLCLDTFPYGGHTTSLDSFWMGVPVVTLVGQTVVGRAGLCFAHNLGLPELAARTPEQFVATAVALAGDLPRLGQLRSELRGRMERSPLMDAPRFAHNLDAAYRWMWRRWCEAATPGR
jgi:predicted O-linked N-acetylglucosamine transferase (SPINDLY family)